MAAGRLRSRTANPTPFATTYSKSPSPLKTAASPSPPGPVWAYGSTRKRSRSIKPTSSRAPYRPLLVLFDVRRDDLPTRLHGRRVASSFSVLYARASKIKLNGVSVARRKDVNPASSATDRKRFSPACAPSARPVSCASDVGTHTIVDAA